MGKRVEFTARCVITADDGLRLTEIGVPQKVADTLTVPVKVTDYNKASLQELVDAGKFKYITRDGSRSSKAVDLEVGATVERFLRDGDVVLFNRQPSLHKQSLMGHHVRILPGNTFRMNVACTSPYNADFDGDEMNIHVPQTVQAREAEEVKRVAISFGEELPRDRIDPGRPRPTERATWMPQSMQWRVPANDEADFRRFCPRCRQG